LLPTIAKDTSLFFHIAPHAIAAFLQSDFWSLVNFWYSHVCISQ